MFLIASIFLVFIAYFVLSQNFNDLLTNYSIKLVQAMADQGVTTVENELRISRKEAELMADSLTVPTVEDQEIIYSTEVSQSEILRVVYISKEGFIVPSDGSQSDLYGREDIVKALDGETVVYGPYFNEENKYVVCYTAPVVRKNKIAGVLSIEKDGYYFCNLIKDIHFANSGESYIINAEGTDIAVSRMDHIDWVNEQYNARKILENGEEAVTRSVMELEQKGLAGETGVGTYYWEGSLCYVVYAPIPSTQWVLLAGLRQEEIDTMTQSVLYSTITKGPTLVIMIVLFLSLMALIIFWILSSMKETAEINEQLDIIAHYDALTGAMNRNSYHDRLDMLANEEYRSLACIYIDVNGLHEINNFLGHQAGDQMLKTVFDVLHDIFPQHDIYRIGGDEFVVFCPNLDEQEVYNRMKIARQELKIHGYEISVGIEWCDHDIKAKTMVNLAEEKMQKDKRQYYQKNGRERQIRVLDQKLEQMVSEKQDADALLAILAPEFKGVYFINLVSDTMRHLFIPPYFEEMLKEVDNKFSKALYLYIHRMVVSQYRSQFEKFCDFSYLEQQLNNNAALEFTYQKIDGSWLKLRILKFTADTNQGQETLWIFSDVGNEW